MEDNQQSQRSLEITDLSDIFIEISDSDAENISGGWGWRKWASVAVGVTIAGLAVLTGGNPKPYYNGGPAGEVGDDDFKGAGGEWNF